MALATESILEEIRVERNRQIGMWPHESDDKYNRAEWMGIITHYLGRVLTRRVGGPRKALVQTATLCVAAIEIGRAHV